ncbi:MAG: hypothetical protein WAO35_04065 [Terriglobia bacterium]
MSRLGQALATLILLTIPTPRHTAQWAPLATDANAHKRIEWWRDSTNLPLSGQMLCLSATRAGAPWHSVERKTSACTVNRSTLGGGGPHDYTNPCAYYHLNEIRDLIFADQAPEYSCMITEWVKEAAHTPVLAGVPGSGFDHHGKD